MLVGWNQKSNNNIQLFQNTDGISVKNKAEKNAMRMAKEAERKYREECGLPQKNWWHFFKK